MMFIKPNGPAAWRPTDIAGCALWLDASDTSSITDTGGAVSAWNDKSGNARHMATVSGTPTTGSRQQNGLNVLDFNNDYMRRSSFWYALGDSTMFVVAIADGSNGQGTLSGVVIEVTEASGSGTPEYGLRFYGTSTRAEALVYNQPTLNVMSVSTTTPYGSWRLWTMVDTTTNMKIYNGGSQEDSDNYTRQSPTFAQLCVGGYAYAGGGNTRQLDGAIAEVIIYDSALGTTDRQTVEAYLAAKWSV